MLNSRQWHLYSWYTGGLLRKYSDVSGPQAESEPKACIYFNQACNQSSTGVQNNEIQNDILVTKKFARILDPMLNHWQFVLWILFCVVLLIQDATMHILRHLWFIKDALFHTCLHLGLCFLFFCFLCSLSAMLLPDSSSVHHIPSAPTF